MAIRRLCLAILVLATSLLLVQSRVAPLEPAEEEPEEPTASDDPKFPTERGIKVVTAQTFDTAVTTYENLFFEFHAPWCGICASFTPGYWLAARALGEGGEYHQEGGGVLAKLDGTVDDDATKALKKEWGVKGYPKLFHFLDGIPVHWTLKSAKVADADDIIQYVSRFAKGKRPWRVLASQDELDDWVREKAPLAMVAAFPTGAKMEEMRPFLKTMRRFEMDMETKGKTISYAVTTKDAVPKLTLSFYPAIAAFVNGELAQGQSEQSTNDFFPDNPQAKANAAKKAEGGGNAAAERIAAAAAQAEQLAAGISEDEMDEL